MATLNQDSPFVSFIMSPEELLQGQLLLDNQRQVIQNLLFSAAIAKINLAWDDKNFREEAELQGQIRAYQTILDNNTNAQIEIRSAMEAASSQGNGNYSGTSNIFNRPANPESSPSGT